MKADELKDVEPMTNPGGPWLVFVNDRKPTLEEAQGFVGGYVEFVPWGGEEQVLVNEDGWGLNLPVNVLATAVFRTQLVGNVLVLEGDARW